jgi:hypothetical protein
MLKMKMRRLLMIVAGLFSFVAKADWHTGQVITMGHAYDGQTITFRLSGWSRTNCTCYSAWPDNMCLDRTRTSFSQDYAWLLRARTTGQKVQVNIDETTCKIVALYEDNN